MDTGVFGVDHLVTLVPEGPSPSPTTWATQSPGPLITAIAQHLWPGPVHDVGTSDAQLALLAKVLAPGHRAVAWCGVEHKARIEANAAVNAVDLDIATDDAFPSGPADPRPALVIVRDAGLVGPATTWANPTALLLLGDPGPDHAAPDGYSELLLDQAGAPATGPVAAVLLVAPDELEAAREALAQGMRALVQRSPEDPVSAGRANHAVAAALRLAELQRQREADRLAEMQRQVDRALDQMRVARAECEWMRRSRSWRLTRFLREFKRR